MKVAQVSERSARHFAGRSALVVRRRRRTIRELASAALEKDLRR